MKMDLYGDGIGSVELIDHMGSDLAVVNAARVSFGKHKDVIDDNDKKLIKYLIKNHHTSPFEHCSITFRFSVPLLVRSQHHRHRTWSFNEISRRYTEENLEFYEPNAFRTQSENNRQASNEDELINPVMWTRDEGGENLQFVASTIVKEHHKNCVNLYNRLLEEGVCREQARGVLPQNLYTQYYRNS